MAAEKRLEEEREANFKYLEATGEEYLNKGETHPTFQASNFKTLKANIFCSYDLSEGEYSDVSLADEKGEEEEEVAIEIVEKEEELAAIVSAEEELEQRPKKQAKIKKQKKSLKAQRLDRN